MAIRLVAAFSLLSAQVGASYSKSNDAEQPEPSGRLALVIGNSAYRNVTPLKNPGNDAKLIAETLRGLGFEVVEKTDLTRKGFQSAVDEVAKKADQYESVLLYYAGHGFQIDGSNYLVPVDSKLRDRKKFASETIDLNGIIGKLEGENRNTLILLDACRDNPIKIEGEARSQSEGLAQMDTGNGTFVAFATQPGNITRDGAGDNSPFSIALAEHMQTEGISISDMMIRVRNTVEERTAGGQTPWDQSSLRSQFYFNPVVEASDSLTEEDLALLEQLDPALREKFMKRFGLNLNEDGTSEGEEVVATVTPSLRIEADNAEIAEVTELETGAEAVTQEVSTAASEDQTANAEEGDARTATSEPPAAPRKPGLMVLAMPDEEPVEAPKAADVAKTEEKSAEQTVAMASPEEVTPVIPKPEPAPVRPEPEKAVVETPEAAKAETAKPEATKPAPESAPVAAASPAKEEPVPGSALSELMVTSPLGALIKEFPVKPEAAPASGKDPAGNAGQPEDIAKAGGKAMEKPIDAAGAKPEEKPAAPVLPQKPANETASAPVKPVADAPVAPKPLPVVPKAPPAPVVAAKPVVPAETKPAPETVVALAKPVEQKQEPANLEPAVSKPVEVKPVPVAPKPEPKLAEPVKQVVPEPAKTAPVSNSAQDKPVVPDTSVKLVPTTPALPSAPAKPAPAQPVAENPVIAAKAPEAPGKPADTPAADPLLAGKPEVAAKPATVASASQGQPPVTKDVDKAGSSVTQPKAPTGAGNLLTATSPVPPAALAVPGTGLPSPQQTAKEQLLAMADPAPATKLAPAATEAATKPDQSTEPAEGKFAIPLPGEESDEDKKDIAIKAQKELKRLGCFRNEADGDWGPRSARALLRFYAEQKLEPDQLEPTPELVSRLTAVDKVVCKNTETDRPKQAVKKAPAKATAKSQTAPAKQKAPAVQKAQPKPAYKAPPVTAKAPPPATTTKKKISGGALIGAFR